MSLPASRRRRAPRQSDPPAPLWARADAGLAPGPAPRRAGPISAMVTAGASLRRCPCCWSAGIRAIQRWPARACACDVKHSMVALTGDRSVTESGNHVCRRASVRSTSMRVRPAVSPLRPALSLTSGDPVRRADRPRACTGLSALWPLVQGLGPLSPACQVPRCRAVVPPPVAPAVMPGPETAR